MARMLATTDQRVDKVVDELPAQIEAAVQRAMQSHVLTPEQAQWVALAIQREAQSIKLRQAVIEKTLSGLIWSGLAAMGYLALEYLKSRGWKP